MEEKGKINKRGERKLRKILFSFKHFYLFLYISLSPFETLDSFSFLIIYFYFGTARRRLRRAGYSSLSV
jgi:hypothetical protein